jgi:COMPASS component SWD2
MQGGQITQQVIQTMSMARVFKDNTAKINSFDYFKNGELLVTASDDESVHIYNTNTGKMSRVIYSKKYGVDLIRFTHSEDAVGLFVNCFFFVFHIPITFVASVCFQ